MEYEVASIYFEDSFPITTDGLDGVPQIIVVGGRRGQRYGLVAQVELEPDSAVDEFNGHEFVVLAGQEYESVLGVRFELELDTYAILEAVGATIQRGVSFPIETIA